MKIIIIHYRYYPSSGPETYLFNVSRLLSENGHTVIPFSVYYQENEKNAYSDYFYKPIIPDFHLNENKSKISFINKIKIVKNSFYNKRVYTQLSQLIKDVKPDIAYVLQYGTKLSTSIFDACYDGNIPVVLRLSDFNLICAKNTFFRDGNICTKCINHRAYSIINKCVHENFTQSFTYFLIQEFNHLRKFQKKINAFVVPSQNTKRMMQQSNQFKNCDFFHIPTFIDSKSVKHIPKKKKIDLSNGLKLCYVGRVSDDKGVDLLIDAIMKCNENGIKVNLDIFGDFNNEFGNSLKEKKDLFGLNNISFLGVINQELVREKVNNYHFSVIPSKWYDNMPNSLIESCIEGVPVIVSRIGSLKELITDGFNGYTFEYLNSHDLFQLIQKISSLPEYEYQEISKNTKSWILGHCDKQNHLNSIENLFKKLIIEKDN